MSIKRDKKDELTSWIFLRKKKAKLAKKAESSDNILPHKSIPFSQRGKKTQSLSLNDGYLMNNNWIVGNWFKTWPTREKKNSKETINLTNNVYNEYLKHNIISVDVIKNPSNSDDYEYILSTLKTSELFPNERLLQRNDMNMNSDKVKRNIEPSKMVSMECALESLPLVYNPSTKQLQFVKVKNNKNIFVTGNCRIASYLKENSNVSKEEINQTTEEVIGLLNNSVINKDFQYPDLAADTKTKLTLLDSNFENAPQSHSLFDDGGYIESPTNTMPRASTQTSLSFTDGSSFSSSNTDISNISNSDSAVCLKPEDSISLNEINYPKKKRGLTNFFNRNLFSWRQKNDRISESRSEVSNNCDNDTVSLSSMNSTTASECSPSSYGWNFFSKGVVEKVNELEAGSAGLIMQGRPKELPAKTAGEEERHKQEYENIVSAAKKKEVKEAKEKRKALAAQLKQEKQLCDAVRTWNAVIIPKWDTMHVQRKCQELWWAGIPSCVRGKIWKLAIGNELHLTKNLYAILVQRSIEKLFTLSLKGSSGNLIDEDRSNDSSDQESTIDLIRLDVSRTFPHLCIFQKGGPFHDPLHNILGAYVCYRPDVGYVQGMSFLAATLLLNMDESEAFISFANLLNRPAHMAFFCIDQRKMQSYYDALEELMKENLPELHEHLKKLNVSPNMFFLDWVLTVFSRSLPLDVAARVWDVYLRDGEEFLFRAALGILKFYEQSLLAQECTAMTAQFLTRLPEDLDADSLFKSIHSIQTTANKRTFKSILDLYTKEKSSCEIAVV